MRQMPPGWVMAADVGEERFGHPSLSSQFWQCHSVSAGAFLLFAAALTRASLPKNIVSKITSPPSRKMAYLPHQGNWCQSVNHSNFCRLLSLARCASGISVWEKTTCQARVFLALPPCLLSSPNLCGSQGALTPPRSSSPWSLPSFTLLPLLTRSPPPVSTQAASNHRLGGHPQRSG